MHTVRPPEKYVLVDLADHFTRRSLQLSRVVSSYKLGIANGKKHFRAALIKLNFPRREKIKVGYKEFCPRFFLCMILKTFVRVSFPQMDIGYYPWYLY